jgi:hypothetical protein
MWAGTTAVFVLLTRPYVMTTAGERPHIMECPDDRRLELGDRLRVQDPTSDPVEIDDIWLVTPDSGIPVFREPRG